MGRRMVKFNLLTAYSIILVLAMLLESDRGVNSSTHKRSSNEATSQVLWFWRKLWIKHYITPSDLTSGWRTVFLESTH